MTLNFPCSHGLHVTRGDSFTAEEVSKGLAISELSAQQWIAQLRMIGLAVLSGQAFRGVPLYKVVLQKDERSYLPTPLPSCGDLWW